MRETDPLTIELSLGHTDKTGTVHRSVTLGNRVTGAVLFAIDEDPRSALNTQYQDLILRSSITRFGTLRTPVSLEVLLSLDSFDRDELARGHNRFTEQSLSNEAGEPLKVEYLADNLVKLAIGYEANEMLYDMVEFGRGITGIDEVDADRLKLQPGSIKRVCFLAGRQVGRLYQSAGASVIEGTLSLEVFERLDAVDIQAIRTASEVWRNSFRRLREAVSRNGRHDPGAGPLDGLERGGTDGPVH